MNTQSLLGKIVTVCSSFSSGFIALISRLRINWRIDGLIFRFGIPLC